MSERPSEAESSTLHNLSEAAEEFVEKMSGTEDELQAEDSNAGDSKMTLEERKAKMEKLRMKMVRVRFSIRSPRVHIRLCYSVLPIWPIVLPSLKRAQRRRSLHGTLLA